MSDLIGLLDLIAPFFGLIAIGFVCAKLVDLEKGGLAWMQFFLIYIALPCLFFRLVADKPIDELANWPFVIATTLATYCAFALAFTSGWWFTRDLPQAVMQGVAGSYSNIGYMGPPLILAALGPAATAPVVLIFVFDNLLLFTLIPLLMAIAGVEKQGPLADGGAGGGFYRRHGIRYNIATGRWAWFFSYSRSCLYPPPSDTMTEWLANAARHSALVSARA